VSLFLSVTFYLDKHASFYAEEIIFTAKRVL
jgi:hypothetical protein